MENYNDCVSVRMIMFQLNCNIISLQKRFLTQY